MLYVIPFGVTTLINWLLAILNLCVILNYAKYSRDGLPSIILVLMRFGYLAFNSHSLQMLAAFIGVKVFEKRWEPLVEIPLEDEGEGESGGEEPSSIIVGNMSLGNQRKRDKKTLQKNNRNRMSKTHLEQKQLEQERRRMRKSMALDQASGEEDPLLRGATF